jgi:hypothetical protein
LEVRLPDESLARWRGGAAVGNSFWFAYWVIWPFATLTVSADELVLSLFGWRLEFPRDRITRLTACYAGGPGPRWVPGLQIEHVVGGIPRVVRFRVLFRLNRVAASLRDFGYVVEEDLGGDRAKAGPG